MTCSPPASEVACEPEPPWWRALAGDVGACLLIAAVLTVIFLPFWGGTLHVAIQTMIANTIISLGIGLTISNLYRFVFPLLAPKLDGPITRFLLHGATAIAAVLIGGEVALRVLGLIGFSTGQMRHGVIQIGLVVVVVVLGFTLAYERLKERARQTELREHETRQRALRAELQALQARTDPHFLFNTLNTVAGLIEEDPRTAERMLERLSGVFRYALDGSRSSWVRLGDELEAVRDYLAVEKIRFGDRLRADVETSPEVEAALVPPLILQPLVENAVLHAIAPRTAGGRIRVEATRCDTSLMLRVTDDGPGPGRSPHQGNGTSVENLRERLRLIYGERATLETGSGDTSGYRATVRLPLARPS